MVRCFFDETFDIAAAHDGDNDIGLTVEFSGVEDRDDVGVITKFTHSLGFAGDAFPTIFIEVFSLYEGKGNIPVEFLIMDKVDLLLAALTEFLLDLVAVIDEEGRFILGR